MKRKNLLSEIIKQPGKDEINQLFCDYIEYCKKENPLLLINITVDELPQPLFEYGEKTGVIKTKREKSWDNFPILNIEDYGMENRLIDSMISLDEIIPLFYRLVDLGLLKETGKGKYKISTRLGNVFPPAYSLSDIGKKETITPDLLSRNEYWKKES